MPLARPSPRRGSRAVSALQRLPGLQQRLEAAQHVHPALARDARGGLRRALELVVHDRDQADAVLARLDLPGHAAALFRSQLVVVERAPSDHEPAWRIRLLDELVA